MTAAAYEIWCGGCRTTRRVEPGSQEARQNCPDCHPPLRDSEREARRQRTLELARELGRRHRLRMSLPRPRGERL